MQVFVLDKQGKPLMPCTPKRARLLLARGRARVHQVIPFVIRLTDRTAESCTLQPLEVKLDPGSKTTGIALVRKTTQVDTATGEVTLGVAVLNLMELTHRGRQISEALTARRHMRRRRRSQLRYRQPRFLNRGNQTKGWLPPSLRHRVEATLNWVARLCKLAPVSSIVCEFVKFDLQLLDNPDISGADYQQGTLAGYTVKEYLLEKWGRRCAYCGKTGIPLEVEHVIPRSKGGTDRVSNLTLACHACNQAKDNLPVEEFLKGKPALLAKIKAGLKAPLKDATAVNATRNALLAQLQGTGLPVTTGSGGQTKYNRSRLGIPKTHALDAVCVGTVDNAWDWQKPTLVVKCMGRGSYQRTRLDRFGFPRGYLIRAKAVKGFQTGDIAQAKIAKGKHAGTWQGRVAVRASGSFNLAIGSRILDGISYKYCKLLQRNDGYGYHWMQRAGLALRP